MIHPVGEYFEGVTYLAYQGPHEDPYVCSYNHTSKQWKGPYRAGINLMGFYPDRFELTDDHGRPTLIMTSDGHIHLFYGGHGGDPSFEKDLYPNLFGNTHEGRNTHVVSRRPRDISQWREVPDISVYGSYAQSAKMDNGDIYVFFRHGAHESDLTYQRSTDGGRSFEPEVSILKCKDTEKRYCEKPGPPCPNKDAKRSKDSWYGHFVKGPSGSPKSHIIGCCFNYHLHENPGHGHFHYNGYYMELDTRDGTWRNIHGKKLSSPVTKEEADEHALVYNSGDSQLDIGTCVLDPSGTPHISWNNHSFNGYWKWQPAQRRWLGPTKLPTPGSNFAFLPISNELEGHTPQAIWWSFDDSPSTDSRSTDWKRGRLAYWQPVDGESSTDVGLTWTRSRVLLEGTGNKHNTKGYYVSEELRNAHPDARVLATEPGPGGYHRIYLVGDSGPIPRIAQEADGHYLHVYNYTENKDMERFPNLTGGRHEDRLKAKLGAEDVRCTHNERGETECTIIGGGGVGGELG